MHELRRPLQVLTLLEEDRGRAPARGPASARRGLLELARGALDELDLEVNGGRAGTEHRRVPCRELVEAALERWRAASEGAGGIRVFWDAGQAPVACDPVRLSQALDNLLANAIEHGGRPLVLTGASVAGRVRITIANGAPGHRLPGTGGQLGAVAETGSAGSADPARGHGIGVVSAVMAEHRGRFAVCRTGSGYVAALELPLIDGGLAQAA